MDGQRLLSLPHFAAIVYTARFSLQWVCGCRYTTVCCLEGERRATGVSNVVPQVVVVGRGDRNVELK